MRKELERTTPESVGIHSEDILHLIDELGNVARRCIV